jgi:hypothetical protein
MLANPLAAPFDRNLLDRNPHAAELANGTAGKVNLDGFEHLTPGERRPRGAAAKQRFVYVVVQDLTKPSEIEPRQTATEHFGQRIANGIGMPEALALDELERQRVDRRRRER